MGYELHFQEGFGGETIIVSVDGAFATSFPVRTRMQIGLAHIEKLQLLPGQRVTLGIADSEVSASIDVDPESPFITINRENDSLVLGTAERTPGYV